MNDNTCIRLLADYVQISECRNKLQMAKKSFQCLSSVLVLVGNEVRLQIVYLLREEKELCPCDLADILGMSVPAVSQHIRKLKDGNIVEQRKSGQTIYYSLVRQNLNILNPLFEHITVNSQKLETV